MIRRIPLPFLLAALISPDLVGQAPPAAASRPSTSERLAAQAKRLVNDLLPPAPDRARVLAAIEVAGLPAPGDAAVDAIMTTASEAHAQWRAAEEPPLSERLLARAAGAAARGGLIGPELVPEIVGRWDDGFRFERDALDDLVSSIEGVPDSDARLARESLAAAEANAIFGRVPLGTIDPKLDLVREATRCVDGTGVDAKSIRGMLAGYATERAALARKLAEARLATIVRGGEVAIAVQAWFARKAAEAGNGAAIDPAAMQGLGIVLQMAPLVGVAGEWQDLQRRGAAAVEGSLPAEATWCVWAALPPGAGGAETRATIGELAASAATLPDDRRAAAEASLRDFRLADLASIRELLAAEIATGQALADLVAPTLSTGSLGSLDLDAFNRSLTEGPIAATGNRLDALQKGRLAAVEALKAKLAPPAAP